MLYRLKAIFQEEIVIRFEELQMRIADSAKNYLEVYDMATFIEQYSLNKECKISMTLPDLRTPYPLNATVSFSYDAQQTSLSLIFDEESEEDFDEAVEVDVVINLPFLEKYNNVTEIFEEIVRDYPDLDPVLIKKEIIKRDVINGEEYEIVYSYVVGGEELNDSTFYDDMFFELSSILRSIYERTKFYIDMSWYREQEDDTF
jgi:hypothetical protein